jgi:hypothetical protein
MQAGLTARPLTLRQIFSWVPPPTANPGQPNWAATPVNVSPWDDVSNS